MSEQVSTAGKFGCLTKDKYNCSMPVTNFMYRPPFYFRDFEAIILPFETDADVIANLVPAELQLNGSSPVAFLMCCNYRFSTVGSYTESVLGISVLWNGEPRKYNSHLFVSNQVAMLCGREIYGFPKILASITWEKEENSIIAYTEGSVGKIITCQMRCERNLPLEAFVPTKSINLKAIPDAEKEGEFAVAQLVETEFKMVPVVGSDGRAELYSGPGNIKFDSPYDINPLQGIPVKKMLPCVYGRFNAELSFGKIIKDYLKD